MHEFPSKEEITNAVINGIKTAKNNYKFWTADEFLSYAPPKTLSIHVCQEIAKLHNTPEIFIDASIADILRCSLPKRDAFKNFMQAKNLSQDIMCITLDERFEHKTDNDSVSKVIMSIKNGVRNVQDEYIHEVTKICKMIEKETPTDSTLEYGIFAFYLDISCGARKKADRRIKEIIQAFDAIVQKHKNLKSNFKGGDINIIENIGEWCVGCYIIEPTF